MPKHDTLTESSLPKAREWLMWLSWNLENLPGEAGVVQLMRDTTIMLHHNIVNCARRLRKNPGWDVQGTLRDDTVKLEEEARENLVHWTKNLNTKDLPTRFESLTIVIEGALKQQVRLAREIDQMQANGFIDLQVTTDRATGNIIEAKY